MATTKSAGMAIEKAHNEALEGVRKLDAPDTAEHVQYLDNMGLHLSSIKDQVQMSSVQSVLISALVRIVEDQARRIAALEEAAKPAASKKTARKGG